MPKLKVDNLNFNDLETIRNLKKIITDLIEKSQSIYTLNYKNPYYFEVSDKSFQKERGWYIILNDKKPIYVGMADNLNKRLNINHGSIDNFAYKLRKSDSFRNFIKKFNELGVLSDLKVAILLEKDFYQEYHSDLKELTNKDRSNLEKFLNIFRSDFTFS